MNNRVVTSLLTLGGVLLAALPMLRRRTIPIGWRRVIPLLRQVLYLLPNRGGMVKQLFRRRVRA